MNTTRTKISIKTLYVLFATVAIALFSACGKSDDVVPNYGSLSVYNASPSLTTYDVYLNGSKLNAANLPWGGGVKYTQLAQGTYEAKFNVGGETTTIYTKSGINVGNTSFNTLYLVGTTGNFDGLLLADNFGTPNAEKAYVRFINLSPDAPALDLGIKDVATAVTTNKAYKASSEFIAVDPGAKVFEIKENTSGTVKSTLESTTLAKASFYTIIAGGKVTPGTNERAFAGRIILHQ